mgnify:FL=1
MFVKYPDEKNGFFKLINFTERCPSGAAGICSEKYGFTVCLLTPEQIKYTIILSFPGKISEISEAGTGGDIA